MARPGLDFRAAAERAWPAFHDGAGAVANQAVIAWLSNHILPHEPDVRAWLRRSSFRTIDPDDLIQEAYARIAASADLGRIESGRAYFFAVVRNLALEKLRRARVVRIEAMAEIERLNIEDDEPSPERVAAGRIELARIRNLIEELPHRCRSVFLLRKVHALPQREIARRLGISENTVEKQAAKGLRLILAQLSRDEDPARRSRRAAHDGQESQGQGFRRKD